MTLPPVPAPDADQVVFVGTGGGRMTTALQARATGGLWVVLGGARVHVDPGPGALVHVRSRALGLDPMTLDAIVLTHKHLDHAGDVNAMIEAMTQGGTQRRGLVLAPEDAYGDDPVILRYVRDYPARTDVLAAGGAHKIGELLLETPLRLRHSVETYGLRLRGRRHSIGLISCTGYFPELEEAFRTDLLILNVVYRSQLPFTEQWRASVASEDLPAFVTARRRRHVLVLALLLETHLIAACFYLRSVVDTWRCHNAFFR